MQSAVETLSPTRVRLTVDVPFEDLKKELDSAYKKIGAQVRVQGFRPGKVPPRILDQRVGRGVVLEEAVQDNRALNVRLAELTDVVTELLLPVAARDEQKLEELLEKYRGDFS